MSAIQSVKDTLVNFASGLGLPGKDKMASSRFSQGYTLDYDELENMYREDWIGGKIIETIPDEMTRNWRTLNRDDLSPEQITLFEKLEKKLKVKGKVNDAMRWGRLYGGALIVINVDDGIDASEPLDFDNIKPGSLQSLTVFDRRYATGQRINNTDPLAENFQQPEIYRLSNVPTGIHYTRVIRFDGIPLPYSLYVRNQYWGDPIFVRIREALINAVTAMNSTAGLLQESNVDVVGVTNLMSKLATDEGTKQIVDRFVTAKFLKSNYSFTAIDKDKESLTKLVNSFASIPDVLDRFMTIVSATSDIPATKLFGKAPVGMNSTGESDLRNFYDMISSRQEAILRPKLEYLDHIMSQSLEINKEINFQFDPLWQIPDTESAQIKLANAQADQIYFDMGILTESMVAANAKQMGTYTIIPDEWIRQLAEAEKDAEERINAENTVVGTGENPEEQETEGEENGETDEDEPDDSSEV